MSNPEVALTLDEAVAEVLGLLTGLDLQYLPTSDRYTSIGRAINRALRANALEHEWSWYASVMDVGVATAGESSVRLPSSRRLRIVSDDAVRLTDDDGKIMRWAYFLPRDALHKYAYRNQLYVAHMPTALLFSRPFYDKEEGFNIQAPVMREPEMIRLPAQPEDPNEPLVPVPDDIRQQELDFQYPDVIVLRAAYYYAQTDPVMQPRVQTLEGEYKDLMYQIIERDDRYTDSPEMTAWDLGIQNGLRSQRPYPLHPHADGRG